MSIVINNENKTKITWINKKNNKLSDLYFTFITFYEHVCGWTNATMRKSFICYVLTFRYTEDL